MALCAYHLARYRDAYPGVWADLEADYRLNEHVPAAVLTALDDAPFDLEHGGREWRRVALDQQGHVHYASRDDDFEPALVELDAEFEVVHSATVEADAVDDYFDGVTRRVGWAAFDDWVGVPGGDG